MHLSMVVLTIGGDLKRGFSKARPLGQIQLSNLIWVSTTKIKCLSREIPGANFISNHVRITTYSPDWGGGVCIDGSHSDVNQIRFQRYR